MSEKIGEAEFNEKAEQAIDELERRFSSLADNRDIDVDVEGGVLTITFEEGEPGKFIVSPNSPARQMWVSARVSSYKFDWSEQGKFVLATTGESLSEVLARLTREQLDDPDLPI